MILGILKLRPAMENEMLRRIVSTKSVTIGGRTMTNHNKLLSYQEGCIGADAENRNEENRHGRCAERYHAPVDDWYREAVVNRHWSRIARWLRRRRGFGNDARGSAEVNRRLDFLRRFRRNRRCRDGWGFRGNGFLRRRRGRVRLVRGSGHGWKLTRDWCLIRI